MIAFSKKALSKLAKESRPRAAGCGDAKQNRRRGATSNMIALGVASQPAVIEKKQQTAKQAKKQNKPYNANNTATATRAPEARSAITHAEFQPSRGKQAVSGGRAGCHRGTQGESLISTTTPPDPPPALLCPMSGAPLPRRPPTEQTPKGRSVRRRSSLRN